MTSGTEVAGTSRKLRAAAEPSHPMVRGLARRAPREVRKVLLLLLRLAARVDCAHFSRVQCVVVSSKIRLQCGAPGLGVLRAEHAAGRVVRRRPPSAGGKAPQAAAILEREGRRSEVPSRSLRAEDRPRGLLNPFPGLRRGPRART